MTVDSPRRENSFRESILAGAPDVIHDFAAAIFNNRFANSCSQIVEDLVPTYAFPISCTTFPDAFERIENSIGIVDLIQRRRPLGAIASARSRIFRIALELLNLICV